MFGIKKDITTHFILFVSFFIVSKVVIQGKCKSVKIITLVAVNIFQPLLIKISPIFQYSEISTKTPLFIYIINNIGKTISQEQRKKISNTLKGRFIGEKHPSSKPILEYSKDGIFIREWPCAMEIERKRGIDHKNISSVCQGKRKSAGGSVWKYKKETD